MDQQNKLLAAVCFFGIVGILSAVACDPANSLSAQARAASRTQEEKVAPKGVIATYKLDDGSTVSVVCHDEDVAYVATSPDGNIAITSWPDYYTSVCRPR